MTEEWKVIPKFPDYLASSLGRVIRFGFKYQRKQGPQVLRPKLDLDGYETVRVWDGKRRWRLRVHRAVAEAFLGPKPDGKEINHKDSNKLNNRPSNLEYVTQKENLDHKFINGRCAKGERNGAAKTTAENVLQIRELAANGYAHKWIAEKFGMSTSATHNIIHRTIWRHV